VCIVGLYILGDFLHEVFKVCFCWDHFMCIYITRGTRWLLNLCNSYEITRSHDSRFLPFSVFFVSDSIITMIHSHMLYLGRQRRSVILSNVRRIRGFSSLHFINENGEIAERTGFTVCRRFVVGTYRQWNRHFHHETNHV